MVTDYCLNQIYNLACVSPHYEICGLVDSENQIYPIRNVSAIPTDFVFSKADYGTAIQRIKSLNRSILCVYHSHLDGDVNPSQNDLIAMNACKLDYLIVACYKYKYIKVCND